MKNLMSNSPIRCQLLKPTPGAAFSIFDYAFCSLFGKNFMNKGKSTLILPSYGRLWSQMRDAFRQYCAQIVPFTGPELDSADKYLHDVSLTKKEYLLRQGKVCNFLAFISAGAIRHFHIKDGIEKTCDISFETSWATDFQSFTQTTPSIMNLQALEDSTLIVIYKTDLYKLYAECPRFETFGRLMAEQAAVRASEIAMSLSSATPEERCIHLLKERPDIFQRVPQKYIANFLGMTPESLSRIRARIKNKCDINLSHRDPPIHH